MALSKPAGNGLPNCEAKYRAMTTITCEIQWLTFLLQDFKVPFE